MALSEQKSSILITGDENGLGLVLAQRLVVLGHQVIVVGRSQIKLDHARKQCEHLITLLADINQENDRVTLFERVVDDFPQVNVLINNAGDHHFLPPLTDLTSRDWEVHQEILVSNLVAPLHLSTMFLPHLSQHAHALIVNVTSIFSFFPLYNFPTYSAANGELFSFT